MHPQDVGHVVVVFVDKDVDLAIKIVSFHVRQCNVFPTFSKLLGISVFQQRLVEAYLVCI